jgi:hypothetical protein
MRDLVDHATINARCERFSHDMHAAEEAMNKCTCEPPGFPPAASPDCPLHQNLCAECREPTVGGMDAWQEVSHDANCRLRMLYHHAKCKPFPYKRDEHKS